MELFKTRGIVKTCIIAFVMASLLKDTCARRFREEEEEEEPPLVFESPDRDPFYINLEENIAPGHNLINLTASSNDVTYGIVFNEYFRIDSDSGQIFIKDDAVIDYEALLPNVTIEVVYFASRPKEKGPDEKKTGILIVNVTDVNEPPTFAGDGNVIRGFNVLNGSKPRTYIGRVEALDHDPRPEDSMVIAYQIRTPGTPFAISNAGTLKIQVGQTVDMNVTHVWTVVIEAVDSSYPRSTGSTTIYIGVCGACVESHGARINVSLSAVTFATLLMLLYKRAWL